MTDKKQHEIGGIINGAWEVTGIDANGYLQLRSIEALPDPHNLDDATRDALTEAPIVPSDNTDTVKALKRAIRALDNDLPKLSAKILHDAGYEDLEATIALWYNRFKHNAAAKIGEQIGYQELKRLGNE